MRQIEKDVKKMEVSMKERYAVPPLFWLRIKKYIEESLKTPTNNDRIQSLCDSCGVRAGVCENPNRGSVNVCDDYV